MKRRHQEAGAALEQFDDAGDVPTNDFHIDPRDDAVIGPEDISFIPAKDTDAEPSVTCPCLRFCLAQPQQLSFRPLPVLPSGVQA